MLIILSFGSALIPLVYLASTWYKDTVTASKCIAPWLIIFGNVVPAIVFPLIWGIALSINESVGIMFGSLIYILNPFATFFVNSYTVLIWHFVGKSYEEARERNEEYCLEYPNDSTCNDLKEENEIDSADVSLFSKDGPIKITLELGILIGFIQALVFLGLTILIELCRSQRFRNKSNETDGKI